MLALASHPIAQQQREHLNHLDVIPSYCLSTDMCPFAQHTPPEDPPPIQTYEHVARPTASSGAPRARDLGFALL